MVQKGISSILIILIIVGVLVIGSVIWYYQKTLQIISQPTPQPLTLPDETADWKTYRNEGYGFEVKYPSNWHIIIEGTPAKNIFKKEIFYVSFNKNEQPIYEGANPSFPVTVSELSLQDSLIRLKGFFDRVESEQAVIQENHFLKLIIESTSPLLGTGKTITVKSEGALIENKGLTYFFYESDLGVQLFNQILSTFKFISPKNCDLYEMPMTEEQIRECTCPDGYKKFNRLSGAYCATDSRKPCSAHTDCPKGEHCISDDGKNWFCTGQFAGCYFNDPEHSTVYFCAD